MPISLPHRRLAGDFEQAGRNGNWRRVGQLIDRNFDELAKLQVEQVATGTQETGTATPTTILSITIPEETTVGIELTVVARRTGGASGTAEDGAHYKRFLTYKNLAGTATQIGSTSSTHTAESQAGWDVTAAVTGDVVDIQVTGAANNSISWLAVARIISVNATFT